jgi:thiosulfate/3-mercaptopyruvate sulfurtransferase
LTKFIKILDPILIGCSNIFPIQMNKEQLIVNGEWLVQQLNNPQVVIIDCRFQLSDSNWGYQQYCESHIPGAYYLDLNRDLSSPVQLHGGRHPLPDVNLLAQKLASIGIVHNETIIIAYDDARFAFAARLWWLLRYLGHEPVALLDGGWKQWQEAGYPITSDIPELRQGKRQRKFLPSPQADWTVDIAALKVRQDLPSTILIDSRDRDRYDGKKEPIDPIAGSIPGAVNSPWKQVSDEQGYLLSIPEQQKLWSAYSQAAEIIVYCGSGVTACVNLFSLQLAGFNNTKLYPGGWSDWCSYL